MGTKRTVKLPATAPTAPVPGVHWVYLMNGGHDEFPESFYQLGVADTAPGTLTVFHATGMFPLATYAPGGWRYVVRMTPSAAVAVPAEAQEAVERQD